MLNMGIVYQSIEWKNSHSPITNRVIIRISTLCRLKIKKPNHLFGNPAFYEINRHKLPTSTIIDPWLSAPSSRMVWLFGLGF